MVCPTCKLKFLIITGVRLFAYPFHSHLNTFTRSSNIEKMTSRLEVLPFGDKVAYHFGQVRAELYSVGKPIGPYDMMIAGYARSLGLKLVTNNINEFERVQGLQVENWI